MAGKILIYRLVLPHLRSRLLRRHHSDQAQHQLDAHSSGTRSQGVSLCAIWCYCFVREHELYCFDLHSHQLYPRGVSRPRNSDHTRPKQLTFDLRRAAWSAEAIANGGSCKAAYVLADVYYACTAVNIVTDWITAFL